MWIIVFILVTLQMTTTLRPFIGKSDEFINLEEKHFFLGYWFKSMSETNQSEADKLRSTEKDKVKTGAEAKKGKPER